jgi:hypothetical protein
MKRFHAHVAVNDLLASINFYSKLFGQPPSKHEADYAKWMLEDPRVNFAISVRGRSAGLNHFGIQADTAEELASLKVLADAASGGSMRDQGKVTCCYADSEKHWTVDPQGLAWEHFMTMSDAIAFGEDTAAIHEQDCGTAKHAASESVSSVEPTCCLPPEKSKGSAQCCN